LRIKIIISFLLGFIYFPIFSQENDYRDYILILRCVEFDGTPSVQEERKDLIFQWHFGDGSALDYGVIVEHCYDSAGTYEAYLSVIEPETKVVFAEEHGISVEIKPDLQLEVESHIIPNSRKVVFIPKVKGELKYDSITYLWDYGDGKFESADEPVHEFKLGNEFQVRAVARVVIENADYFMAKKITVTL